MKSPTFTHRQATVSDVDKLVALANSAYRGESGKKGWTTESDLLDGQRTDPQALADLLREKDSTILVFERASELVACVHLKKRGDAAYLGMLSVNPTQQARGTGRHVLETAECWAQSQWGVGRIEMHVIRQRGELIAWYERRGYTNTGRTEPFPANDPRFGIPKISNLEFIVLEKTLALPA